MSIISFPSASSLRLSVHAKPGARCTRFCDLLFTDGKQLVHVGVQLAARPVDGEANDELLRFVREAFGVKRRGDCHLVKGEKSRDKIVQVDMLPGSDWTDEKVVGIIKDNM